MPRGMGPRKRRGRKPVDETSVTQPTEATTANNQCGDDDDDKTDVMSSSASHEEHSTHVSPILVGDRKLSSAVLVLQNCLLSTCQRSNSTSPSSCPSEGLEPRSESSSSRHKASSVRSDVTDDSFTEILSAKVAEKEDVDAASDPLHVVKSKRIRMAKKSKPRLKTVLKIVPGNADLALQPLEVGQNTIDAAEHDADMQAADINKSNLGLRIDTLLKNDEKALGTEDFEAKSRRNVGVKKTRHANKKRKRNTGNEAIDVVDPKTEEDENGTTWMVSPSSGDEERVILKRRRKISVPQDPVLADVVGGAVLNVSTEFTPKCTGYGSYVVQGSDLEQNVAQDGIESEKIVADVGAEAVSQLSTFSVGIVKKKRGRKAAKTISADNSESQVAENSGLPVKKRTRLKGNALKPGKDSEGQATESPSTRVTRSRRNGNNGGIQKEDCDPVTNLNAETNRPADVDVSEVIVDCSADFSSQEYLPDCGKAKTDSETDKKVDCVGKEFPIAAELPPSSVAVDQESVRLDRDRDRDSTSTRSMTSVKSFTPVVGGNEILRTGNSGDNPVVELSVSVPPNPESFDSSAEISECRGRDLSESVLNSGIAFSQRLGPDLCEASPCLKSFDHIAEDPRGDSDALRVERSPVVPVVPDSVDKPVCNEDIKFENPPSENTPLNDVHMSTDCRNTVPLEILDTNLCETKMKESVSSVSLPASSVVENITSVVQDGSDKISQPDVSSDVASEPIVASLPSTVDSVDCSAVSVFTQSIVYDDPPVGTECGEVVKHVSGVSKVDPDENKEPASAISEDGCALNTQQTLTPSDAVDAGLANPGKSKSRGDVEFELIAKPATISVQKDGQGSTDGRKPEGAVEETGFVPLKKRRLRMAEPTSEFSLTDAKSAAASDAVSPGAELAPKDPVCADDLAGAKTSNGSSDLSTLTLSSVDTRAACNKYVGAHVSTAGGLSASVLNASRLGARAFALFIKPQKTWTPPPLDEQEATAFKELLTEKGYSPSMVVPHGSYLLNCGSSDAEHLRRSREALVDDLRRCQSLGLSLFNFHPGSFSIPDSPDECIARVAESINYAHGVVPDVVTVIENSCGELDSVGGSFTQLKQIIEKVTDKSRIGVCLDTCHAFAAGYDLREKSGYTKMMEDFDAAVGREFLKVVHANDSKDDLGSHLDHHASIGKGKIGLPCFKFLMADRSLENIPIILETPLSGHKHEIELLYSFVSLSE